MELDLIYPVAQEIRFFDLITFMRDSGYEFAKPPGHVRSVYNQTVIRNRILVALIFLVVVGIGWRMPNFRSHQPLQHDPGYFFIAANSMVKGKVLYRDIMDTKPPLIHFMLSTCIIGQSFDDDVRNVRILEKSLYALTIGTLYLIVYLATSSVAVSFFGTSFAALYACNSLRMNYGHYAEDYGILFFFLAILSMLPTVSIKIPRFSIFLTGMCIVLASLCKELFVLYSLPIIAYTLKINRDKGSKFSTTFLLGLMGGFVAFLPILGYFLYHNALGSWLDQISFNIAYTKNFAGGYGGSLLPIIRKIQVITSQSDGLFNSSAILTLGLISYLSVLCPRYSKSRFHLPFVLLLVMIIHFGLVFFMFKRSMLANYSFTSMYLMALSSAFGLDFCFSSNHELYQNAKFYFTYIRHRVICIPLIIMCIGLSIYFLTSLTRDTAKAILAKEKSFISTALDNLATPFQTYNHYDPLKGVLEKEIISREGLVTVWPYHIFHGIYNATSPTLYGSHEDYWYWDTFRNSGNRLIDNYFADLEASPPALAVFSHVDRKYFNPNIPFFKNNYTYLGDLDVSQLKMGTLPAIFYIRNDLVNEVINQPSLQ